MTRPRLTSTEQHFLFRVIGKSASGSGLAGFSVVVVGPDGEFGERGNGSTSETSSGFNQAAWPQRGTTPFIPVVLSMREATSGRRAACVAQAKRIVPQIGAIAKKVPRRAGCFHGLSRRKPKGRRQGTWMVARHRPSEPNLSSVRQSRRYQPINSSIMRSRASSSFSGVS